MMKAKQKVGLGLEHGRLCLNRPKIQKKAISSRSDSVFFPTALSEVTPRCYKSAVLVCDNSWQALCY